MEQVRAETPMWLAHHWPDQQDRCVRIAGRRVCRRCVVLYPLVVVWAGLLVVVAAPAGVLVAAMWLLPLPMSIEWVAEHLGRARYSPRRQVAVTVLASVGIGAALAAHLHQPFDPDALAPMATHVTICAVTALRARRRPERPGEVSSARSADSWEQEHERREAERAATLQRLLDDQSRRSVHTE